MRKVLSMTLLLLLFAVPGFSQRTDWEPVEKTLGRRGVVQGEFLKVTFPRTDLEVAVGGVPVDARIGLATWIAFGANQKTMVTGELVLKKGEVKAVVGKLAAEKIEVTALHNHLMNTSEPLMQLHFFGTGDAVELAASLRDVIAQTGTPFAKDAKPPETVPEEFSIIQYFLGDGNQAGSVLSYAFPRSQTVMEHDREIPGFMGTATTFHFQAGEGKTAATGEFVLTAQEVSIVINALIENGITITAVHNFLLRESPRLFSIHFWAYDSPQAVANGLRAALDAVNIRKQSL